MLYRLERDTLGDVKVPDDKYWGAQTQRSLQNFNIGGPQQRMPIRLIKALAIVKKAAAAVNLKHGLTQDHCRLIQEAADEVKLF